MLKIWTLVCLLASIINYGAADSDSRCANTNCTPAPNGAQCTSSYDRDDGCCPVWTCSDGSGGTYTVYGKSSSSSYSSGSSSSYSSSSSSGGGMPPMIGLPGLGFPGFLFG